MINMSDINHIRDMAQSGYKISEISKALGKDPKTVRKYLEAVYCIIKVQKVAEQKCR